MLLERAGRYQYWIKPLLSTHVASGGLGHAKRTAEVYEREHVVTRRDKLMTGTIAQLLTIAYLNHNHSIHVSNTLLDIECGFTYTKKYTYCIV